MPTARFTASFAVLLGLAAAAAPASTFTTDTSVGAFNTDLMGNPLLNQGFYYSYGFHDATNDNHSTGGNTSGDGPGGVGTTDVRSFYTFDLSGLNLSGEVVTGATLTFNPLAGESGISTSGQTTEPLQLYTVQTSAATLNATQTDPTVFQELGGQGTLGGAAYLNTPDAFPLTPTSSTSLSLNAAALAAITADAGGFFSIGATVLNLPSGPNDEESLFGGSSTTVVETDPNNPNNTQGYGIGTPQTLTLTLAPAATAVPEASQVSYLALGGLMLGGVLLRAGRRSRRTA